jgi:sulfur carrier protein
MKVKIFLIEVFFNGELYKLQTYKLLNLKDLIRFFNYKQNLIVVEYNGKIFHPKIWSKIKLKNTDKIEIVTIVGGG